MAPFLIELSAATANAYRDLREIAVKKYAEKFGIEADLIRAFIRHESKNFPRAERNDKANLSKQPWTMTVITNNALDPESPEIWHSMGLMQILFLCAVDLGFKGKPIDLLDIDIGVLWGCTYLKRRCMSRYTVLEDVIAAYNQGNNRWFDLDKDGIKDANERYRNQEYVDAVMLEYRAIKAEK